MNSLIVQLIQMSLTFMILYYAIYGIDGEDGFSLYTPKDTMLICVRYIASLMMHLNVEKDVRNGISMMKYAVNHPQNFTNLPVAFLTAFFHTINNLTIEICVILVLISQTTLLDVIMKYVPL